MGKPNIEPSTLFIRDNLEVMRGFEDEIFDLIYLDPPFNSNRNYNVIFKDKDNKAKQEQAFKDVWTMDDIKHEEIGELAHSNVALYDIINAVGVASGDSHKAYLAMMGIRLLEMHRILKPTGSLYLHCDPTMSHSLKLVLDCIFGRENYRNQIVWERSFQHNLASTKFDTVSDVILLYSKSDNFVFNPQYQKLSSKEMDEKFPYTEKETNRRYNHQKLEQSSNMKEDDKVRIIQGKKVTTKLGWRWSQKTFDERLAQNPHLIHWTKAGKPRYKTYADEYKGRQLTNIWSDIKGLASNDKERTPYPTQKPLALLGRIIKASTPKKDAWVLDPFCGCATTCVAAQLASHNWVGIDIADIARDLVKGRLRTEIPLETQTVHERNDIPQRRDAVKRIPKERLKQLLFGIQEGFCLLCLRQFGFEDLVLDHELARAVGGRDDYRNMQLLCWNCNSRIKGAKSMQEARIAIKKLPYYKPENEPKYNQIKASLTKFRTEISALAK